MANQASLLNTGILEVWIFSSHFSLAEPLCDVLPVSDGVDGLHVIGPDVLVLEVVGVLPDVDAKQGNEAGGRLEGVLGGGEAIR
jgi:hypothetical protein